MCRCRGAGLNTPYTQHVQDKHVVLVVVQGAECSHQPVGILSFFLSLASFGKR